MKINIARSFAVLFIGLIVSSPLFPAQPVPFTSVSVEDEFWKPRIETNRTVSIPSAFKKCEETGRMDNFALAGGLIKGEHKGDYPFDDTDPYKIIEGASYSLAVHYDKKLDEYVDGVIRLIAAAQEKDGYLYTCRTNNCARLERWMGKERWEKLNSHELYNCGHLYEAAVAHFQATGKRSLLDVALKNADLIDKVFGPGPDQKKCPSGHPIIEMALVKLYRVTGDKKYLNLAHFFIEEAGRGHDGHKLSQYSQDHKPVIDQDEVVGHAVRAGYFYSGIADVAGLTNDKGYMKALERLWDNMTSKKLYITGGIGARGMGEGFGDNYELPNMTAYCETCASIANVYWNYRMFLMYEDAKFYDVLERTLYNGVLSGVSLSGDRFFYDNPLESNGSHERAPWFGCACCPGNVTRFISSVPGYIYAEGKNEIFVNLFIGGKGTINLGGEKIEITQETEYPWKGDVTLILKPGNEKDFSLALRIPGWAQNTPLPGNLYGFAKPNNEKTIIEVNGKQMEYTIDKGYARIQHKWKNGDRIALHFPMPVRRVIADSRVEDDKGKTALMRGPIVFCLEGKDQPGGHASNLFLPMDEPVGETFVKDLLGGVVVLEGKCKSLEKNEKGEPVEIERLFKAIPYSTWNNRGRDEMIIWLPTNAQNARAIPDQTIASKSKASSSVGFGDGLNDLYEPKSSNDTSKPFFYWWLKKGTDEWVQYDFEKPETVSNVSVYWLVIDHYDCSARLPQSWEIEYKLGSEWKKVETQDTYKVTKDEYNTIHFKPITTDGLRIRVKLAPEYSGGIIEWKVN